MGEHRMVVAKVFAVVAAVFLVGAVAIVALGPDDMTLAEGIATLNAVSLRTAERIVRSRVSDWTWDHPIKAVLFRPVWLLPVCLGLISTGVCLTAMTGSKAMKSRRRRS